MRMPLGNQLQHVLSHLPTAGGTQRSQSGMDSLDQRRTPALGLHRLLHLLPERFPLLRQKARSLVVRAPRFVRQSLPEPVILAVGGLSLQVPPARTSLHHGARIPLDQTLIAVLRSPVIAPRALQPGGEARQRLMEWCTTSRAQQFQHRRHRRLP